jgi:hypothetical protein
MLRSVTRKVSAGSAGSAVRNFSAAKNVVLVDGIRIPFTM